MRDRGLRQIGEENDLKAYQADQSGFLWAVLEVLRHTDAFSEPDFQALIERGRLAAIGQGGMMSHSADIAKADDEQRKQQYEQSEPGVGPPRPVMPGEGDSPAAEAQRLAEQDPRMVEAAERQSEAERLGVSEQTAVPRVREQTEAAEEAIDTDDDEEDDDLDSDERDTGRTHADRVEQSENVEPSPDKERAEAEKAAKARGLEIRDWGTEGAWRVFEAKTGRMVAKSALETPLKAGAGKA